MTDEKRDGWAKFDILVKAMAGILLPVIIFAVGAWYTSNQRKAADARLSHEKEAEIDQRNTDRAASLIKNLSSDNKRERLLAVNLVQHFNGGELTEQIKKTLVTVAFTEDDPRVADSATAVVSSAIKKGDPTLVQTVRVVAQSNPNSLTSKNPQLNEALANIAVNGQGEDRKVAAETLRVLSVNPSQSIRDLKAGQNGQDRRSEGSLRVIDNNPLSLVGDDKEVIKVDIKTKGTTPMVYGSLNGKRVQGDSLSFTLDKSQSNPVVLVLLFSFSGGTGGEYTITVRDANSAGAISVYTVRQDGMPGTALTYTFAIS